MFGKDVMSGIQCNIDLYGSFLLSLVTLVMLGIVLGQISQSAKKLFIILNRCYCYLVLPCISLQCGIAVELSRRDNVDNTAVSMILGDFIAKVAVWLIVVLGALVIFRNRAILKTAAITAQFIIHGNDIGFSKTLLESSCIYVNHTTKPGPINNSTVSFASTELTTNAMAFLVFLPLTHGIVDMSNKNQMGLRQFVLSCLQQCYRLIMSYLALVIGFIIAFCTKTQSATDIEDYNNQYFGGVQKMINFSGTMQTLNCGIFIYFILMKFDWDRFNVKKVFALATSTTIAYPVLYVLLVVKLLHRNDITVKGDEIVILIAHSITPASVYLQYYIMKNESRPNNFIVAYVVSTFIGSLLMYTAIMDYQVFDTNFTSYKTPVDYYVENQRHIFVTMSVMISLFAMLIYGRWSQSRLRIMIFVLMLFEFSGNTFLVVADVGGYLNCRCSISWSMCLSGFLMFAHIDSSGIILLLNLYPISPTIIKKWHLFLFLVIGISLVIPALLYFIVWNQFKDMTSDDYKDLTYRYKDIDLFLDISYKNLTNDQVKYPISVVAYTCINGVFVVLFIIMFIMTRISRRTAPNIVVFDKDDKEKFRACKLMAYYHLTPMALSFVFTIRNLYFTNIRGGKPDKTMMFDYIFEGIELFSLLLSDLSGLFMTIIFCVSPGEMEIEYDRLMFLPRKIRSKAMQGCDYTPGRIEVHDLPNEVLNRCRVFVQYHKHAFVGTYQKQIRDGGNLFKGADLIDFLIDTEVADSQGEAFELCNSYLKGYVFKVDQDIFRTGMYRFKDNMNYIFIDEGLPDYQSILTSTAAEPPVLFLE